MDFALAKDSFVYSVLVSRAGPLLTMSMVSESTDFSGDGAGDAGAVVENVLVFGGAIPCWSWLVEDVIVSSCSKSR